MLSIYSTLFHLCWKNYHKYNCIERCRDKIDLSCLQSYVVIARSHNNLPQFKTIRRFKIGVDHVATSMDAKDEFDGDDIHYDPFHSM